MAETERTIENKKIFDSKKFFKDMVAAGVKPSDFQKLLTREGYHISEAAVYKWYEDDREKYDINIILFGLLAMKRSIEDYVLPNS